jgi:hypothetical protein
MLRALPIRIVAVPLLAGCAALAAGWLYARRAPRPTETWSRLADRDPLGPSEAVVSALSRTSSMKISTEAEALSSVTEEDG